jgi:hypothetical protein
LKNHYKECITKYPEAAPSLQKLYKVLWDIGEVAKYTHPSVGKNEDWVAIVSSAVGNRETCHIYNDVE